MDQGEVSLPVMVSTLIAGDGFDGGGAPVWPGNAGFGLCGRSPANRLDWARTLNVPAIARRRAQAKGLVHKSDFGCIRLSLPLCRGRVRQSPFLVLRP